jgi:hypothetical protein
MRRAGSGSPPEPAALLGLASLMLLGLAACSPPASTPAPVTAASAPQFDTGMETAELMRRVIDPTAVSLWSRSGETENADGTISHLPPDDAQWMLAENEAATLIEAGNMLQLPSRIRSLGPLDDEWPKFARGLSDAARAVLEATKARDPDRILATGGDLYDACSRCHEKYYLPFFTPAPDAPGAPGMDRPGTQPRATARP